MGNINLQVSLLALATALPAYAQAQDIAAPTDSRQEGGAEDGGLFSSDEIVVTGTSSGQEKFKAPFSISTIDRETIDERAPHSVVDLLRSTPGLTVENSGGEAGSENVVIRGLPWSGWRLIDFMQDGMPLYESNTEGFMNIDELYRVDLSNIRAEVVRGGTAPLYSNNASGGVVNFITEHGEGKPYSVVKVETGTGNRLRGDFVWSGRIAGDLSGSISGFYRRDDGLRDPGFSGGDQGGQVRAAFTYSSGTARIWGDLTYLNDRGLFYTAVPLTDPRDGSSLRDLIDPTSGTLTSAAFRNVTIRTLENGRPTTIHRDLKDGIHPQVYTGTLGGNFELGDGFEVSNTYRHTEGTLDFDAIFNGATPSDAGTFLAGQLTAAKNAFGPGVSSLRYVVAGTNTAYDPATTRNLVMTNGWNDIHTRIRYDANDLRLSKKFATSIGEHHLTVGLYYSDYSFTQLRRQNSMLMNVKDQPIALDIQALSGTGTVLGYVTENGFTTYGAGSQNGSLDGRAIAIFGSDTWQVTPDWKIDAGVRHVDRKQEGVQGVLGTVAADPTGPIPARNVQGVVSTIARREVLRGTSWTVGTGYDFSRSANAFARYTRTFSYPRFDTILGGASLPGSTRPLPVATVQQAEGGLKLALPGIQIFAVGFWSKFDKLNGSTQVAAANGAITNSNIIFDTRTLGLELEAVAPLFPGFDITASGMIQDPKTISITTLTGLDAESSRGGEIPRVPKVQLTLQPSYRFTVGELDTRIFGSMYTIGRRFQDYSNLSRLPAYTSFDLGASVRHSSGWEIRGLINNLTNQVGLTEGNARASVLGTGGVGDATVGRSIFGRNFTLSLAKRW